MTAQHRDVHEARIGALTGGLCRPGGLALTDRALALCRLPRGARVLDLGCGSGATVRHLLAEHQLRAFGVDRSAEQVPPGGARWPFVQADAACLPLPDALLDAILAECVLSTLADPVPALAELARVLAPRGSLIVTDVYARGPEGAAELLDRVRGQGFEITAWQDHSATLRDLAVRLVWTYGSEARSWPCFGSTDAGGTLTGYYLLVARKTGR